MTLSNRWFPQSLSEQAAWMRNFALKMGSVGASLGFSAAEIAQAEADADALAWDIQFKERV
jgi:hypothetical protein